MLACKALIYLQNLDIEVIYFILGTIQTLSESYTFARSCIILTSSLI